MNSLRLCIRLVKRSKMAASCARPMASSFFCSSLPRRAKRSLFPLGNRPGGQDFRLHPGDIGPRVKPAQPMDQTLIGGGGLVGLSFAHYLAKAGHPVQVIERDDSFAQSCSAGNAGRR
jgi:hypothetical protein